MSEGVTYGDAIGRMTEVEVRAALRVALARIAAVEARADRLARNRGGHDAAVAADIRAALAAGPKELE